MNQKQLLPVTVCPKCNGDRYRIPSGGMRCGSCDSLRAKNYHGRNHDKHKERVKAYYQENKEVYKRSALKNLEVIKERNRLRRLEHIEEDRERHKLWRSNNKEKVKETNSIWRENNPDKILESQERSRLRRHPLYAIWNNIIQRCYNPDNINFSSWGELGVGVYELWWIFEDFVKDIPPRPSLQHSLDRYPDKFGDYVPGNVRWATSLEQNRNRRNSLYVDYNGEVITLSEAAEREGISYTAAASRYKNKASKRMLTTLNGRHISIEQLSKETGIDERVLLRRAKRTTSVEYLTSNFRAASTHEYQGWQYTLFEIALIENIDFRELLKQVVKQNISLLTAIQNCRCIDE